MRGRLPDAVIDRRKQGFGVPLGLWFRGQLSGFLRDLLLSGPAKGRGLFDPRYVQKLIERHERGQDLGLHLWTLISFELWCRAFLDGTTRRVKKTQEKSHEVSMAVGRSGGGRLVGSGVGGRAAEGQGRR